MIFFLICHVFLFFKYNPGAHLSDHRHVVIFEWSLCNQVQFKISQWWIRCMCSFDQTAHYQVVPRVVHLMWHFLLGSPNIWSFEDQLWGQGFVNNQKKNNWNYIFPKLATNMPQYTTFHWLCVTKNIAKYKQF